MAKFCISNYFDFGFEYCLYCLVVLNYLGTDFEKSHFPYILQHYLLYVCICINVIGDFMRLSEYKCEENIKQEKKQKNEEKIEDMYEKYKNFNQNDLTNELFNNIAKQKKDGTFDYEKIKNTITQIMPYLKAEQQKNLLSILEKIK